MVDLFKFLREINFKKIISKFFFFNEIPAYSIFFNSKFFFILFLFYNNLNNNLKKKFFFLNFKNNRFNKRIKQIKNNSLFQRNQDNYFFYKSFLQGYKYFWLGVRFWVIPFIIFSVIFFFLCLVKIIPLYKFTFVSFVILSLFYWLISGFTFFIKKYRYRYFTSSIQRFWKRCFSIFWILEFFLFFCFFYLTMMASQEPFFMFDNSQIFKTHLFSWKLFFIKIFPSTILIILTYFLLISVKWNTFSKLNFIIIIITFLLFLILWLEFYQFFHIISFYGNFSWKYDEEDSYWFLDNELRRTRVSNNFLTICLIAKFWHVVFATIFWFFFIFRCLEINKFKYSLLAANYQNFILIYILSWIYMFPWFKYFFLKLFNNPYYWFYVNNKRIFIFIFINDSLFLVKNLFHEIFFKFNYSPKIFNHFITNFFYFKSDYAIQPAPEPKLPYPPQLPSLPSLPRLPTFAHPKLQPPFPRDPNYQYQYPDTSHLPPSWATSE